MLTDRPVAIFPWGDVIEEFLQPLGLTPEDYASRMRGGWLFGFVAALQRHGRSSVIVYGSETVREPTRLVHAETGAPIWLVPARRSGGGLTKRSPSLAALAGWARAPLPGFAKILRREGCAAVLIQDYEHPRFEALVLLSRALGLPALATFQGGDTTLSPIERRVRPQALRACRAVIVPSARERRRLTSQHRIPADAVLDIPNPLDADLWRAAPKAEARAALGLPPEAFVVMNHGRIDIARKGLDVLIDAWWQVAAARPDAVLAMIGSGQDRDQFRTLGAAVPRLRWLDDYVTDPPLVRQWLSAADAYVTLSRLEGMPVAPLEAMACGLPVVASDTHGLADIFADGEASGGLLVPVGDAPAAARALLRLAADPDLRRTLGAAARATILARYGLDTVGAALADALKPAVRRTAHRAPLAPAMEH